MLLTPPPTCRMILSVGILLRLPVEPAAAAAPWADVHRHSSLLPLASTLNHTVSNKATTTTHRKTIRVSKQYCLHCGKDVNVHDVPVICYCYSMRSTCLKDDFIPGFMDGLPKRPSGHRPRGPRIRGATWPEHLYEPTFSISCFKVTECN